MTKKEINELRKRFKSETCSISAMSGCYVDGEKRKVMQFCESFLMLEEEERFKYFEIFKKAMSGTPGRNLFSLEFPMEAEEIGGGQDLLMQVRACGLKDEAVMDAFYDKIIDNFLYEGNYLILVIHDAYDIPGRATDGTMMEDASEEVFTYFLCCVCPVNLTKPALCYDPSVKHFHRKEQDWVLEAPEAAFLFPSFRDRTTDIHGALFYTGNVSEPHTELVEQVLCAAETVMPATSQREVFDTIIAETLGDACDYESVMSIQDTLLERMEEAKDLPEPLALTRHDVKTLFQDSGATPEQLERLTAVYDQVLPEATPLVATNIASTRKVEVKTSGITVQIKPDCAHLVETRVVDGKNCLVITMDDAVEVNGIAVTRYPVMAELEEIY